MSKKDTVYKAQALVFIIIVIGIIIVFNVLSSRFFTRIDLTENKQYTISPATVKLLKDMDDIVNINVYFSKKVPSQVKKIESDIQDLLTEFKAYAGGNLNITWEDPADDEEVKKKAEAMGVQQAQVQAAEKHKVEILNVYMGMVVLYADKKETLPLVSSVQTLEYDLAQAIMRVYRDKAPQVAVLKTDTTPYFDPAMRMQMRGQLPPDPTEQKYAPIFSSLKGNYDVKMIDASKGEPISSEIKTLIVPGGDAVFYTDKILYVIDQYLMNGGNVVVLADAVSIDLARGAIAQKNNTKLLSLLEHYGVRVEQSLVLDVSCGQVQVPQPNFPIPIPRPYPYFTIVTDGGFNKENPAVSGLAEMTIPWGSPLTSLVKEDSDLQAVPLFTSSEQSFIQPDNFNLDPRQNWDQLFTTNQGILQKSTLSMVVSGKFTSYFDGKTPPSDAKGELKKQSNGSNLVVVGDSDFLASNQGGSSPRGNTTWLVNITDWLSMDNNLISIRSRNLENRTLSQDALKGGTTYANAIQAINISLVPTLLALLGLFVHLRRRETGTALVRPTNIPKKDNAQENETASKEA